MKKLKAGKCYANSGLFGLTGFFVPLGRTATPDFFGPFGPLGPFCPFPCVIDKLTKMAICAMRGNDGKTIEAEKLDGWADDLKLGLERENKEIE